jgi:gamma-glutamyl-gamma-aminobutyrate hydrolase PuuD
MESEKPIIGIIADDDESATLVARLIERNGGCAEAVPPGAGPAPEDLMSRIGGIVVTQGGETPFLLAALDADIPVLCTGQGMHALNLAMGGSLVADLSGHDSDTHTDERQSSYHRIFITPGSKLAATVGSGGFVRVNSRHRDGVKEAQKSSSLMASAYSLEDGVIEALESPHDRWVIGVQFQPERRGELPPHFDRLFGALVKRAMEATHTTI